MKRNQSTGTLYAFVAAIALAASFVFSKSALNNLSMVHFGLIWFTLGVPQSVWFFLEENRRGIAGRHI